MVHTHAVWTITYTHILLSTACVAMLKVHIVGYWGLLQCSWVANGDPADLCLPTTLVCVTVKSDEDI